MKRVLFDSDVLLDVWEHPKVEQTIVVGASCSLELPKASKMLALLSLPKWDAPRCFGATATIHKETSVSVGFHFVTPNLQLFY
ncbi:MAG: hypothetical protein F6K14_02110 [Symploca sp. SIO2C1]|nr:hypothetical protein [Symploca sp. SIO2C1]